MSDFKPLFRAAVAAVALAAGHPAAAIGPVDHPAQLLQRMKGEDLVLESPAGKDLMNAFFQPRSANDTACRASAGRGIGIDTICEYRRANDVNPELFLGIAGTAPAARISSVVLRYPLPGVLWRCKQASRGRWVVCIPKDIDGRADAKTIEGWNRMIRPGGHLGSPSVAEQMGIDEWDR